MSELEARFEMRGSVNLMAAGSVAWTAELAAQAEHLGYTRVWVADEGIGARDAFVSLSAVAAATSKVRIGPGITNPYIRHPAITASAIASLDELSEGRAFLGLGAGGGLALGPLGLMGERSIRAVEEMVTALRRLWSGESVSFEGRTLRLQEARLVNPRPGIEIHMAGRGRRMIDLAGRMADGFCLSYIHKDRLGELGDRLGRSGRKHTLTYSTRVVLDDWGWEMARRDLSFRLPDSPSDVLEAAGIGLGDVAALRAALARGGPPEAARLVADAWVEPFVIIGSAAECSIELRRRAASHGFDEIMVVINDRTDPSWLEVMAPIIGLEVPGRNG